VPALRWSGAPVTRRQELEERVSRLEYRDRVLSADRSDVADRFVVAELIEVRAELAEAKADLAALGGA
jgi:hypothetical protein